MKRTAKAIFSILISIFIAASILPVCSFATEPDIDAVIEERKNIPIESNSIPSWPVGPQTNAQSAMLIEAKTGIVLYEKNVHERLYPASITKILTALIAYEHCDMDEEVTLPEGYVVEEMPKPETVQLPGYLAVTITFEMQENNLVTKYQSIVDNTFIPATEYANLQEFWNKVLKINSMMVCLKKS